MDNIMHFGREEVQKLYLEFTRRKEVILDSESKFKR